MILYNELQITKPILGCKVVSGKPRQLLRDASNRPGLVEPVWNKNFENAASALNIDFKSEMVTFPTGYEASKFEEFLRTYSKFKKERFESIPEGAKIWFDVMLSEGSVSPTDYAKLLTYVGRELGISQFGNKFGFGRFEVLDIRRKSVSVKLNFQLNLDE